MVDGKESNLCDLAGIGGAQKVLSLRAALRSIRISRRGILSALRRCMEKSRDLRVRGFWFTVAIVRFCRDDLSSERILTRLAYQLVDAAGSTGANLEESSSGQSKADFIAKQSIALKEAKESRFWLRVVANAYPHLASKIRPHLQECSEIIAMLTASIRTARSNPHRGHPQPGPD